MATANRQVLARAAIALNNSAVHLLELGSNRAAFATAKNAVSVMKVAFLPLPTDRSTDTGETNLNQVEHMIQLAAQNVSNPSKSSKRMTVRVFSDDACQQDVESANQVHSNFLIAPIRLESCNCDAVEDQDAGLIAAQVLFNFAVTHIGVSHTEGPDTSTELLKGAVKLLTLSNTIISNRCKTLSIEDVSQYLNLTKLMYTGNLVLGTLYQVYLTLGMSVKAKECYAKMSRLQAALHDLGQFQVRCFASSTASAAAA